MAERDRRWGAESKSPNQLVRDVSPSNLATGHIGALGMRKPTNTPDTEMMLMRTIGGRIWLAAVLMVGPGWFMAAAQTPGADTAVTEADAAYIAHDWARAEVLYSALAKASPESARWWYRLGTAQRGEKHYDAALQSFAKARELGANKGLSGFQVDYEEACTLAAAGEKTRALAKLKSAVDSGFFQVDRIETDAEWRELRDDAQFSALAKEVHHNAAPCEDAEYRQLDFWVGDWDVVSTADGTPRGTSHVSKEMGGCVVWENWTSAGSPYFGKSYNTYNANLHRWEQYWVDNSAGTIFFHGSRAADVMDYWTDDVPQPNGEMLRRHLQFFNLGPDVVRQFSQGSRDGGKTWTVEYDLTYHRRPVQKAELR